MSTRFVSAALSYGCQERPVELGSDGRPCVVAGPNGSGKTTLVEGIMRTLYGFNRKRPEDRTVAERREPWTGEPFTGLVVLERSDGTRLEVSRDFATDRVTVLESRPSGAGKPGVEPLFDGTASGGSAGRPSETYRAILEEWLGFDELDDYRRTMCIEQGDLATTRLADHLLQLAAGGHAALDAAKDSVRASFRELTRQPLDDEDRRRPKDRKLETARKEIEELGDRLRIARETEKSRQPLRQEERDLAGRSAALEERIVILEDALQPLARLEKLRQEHETGQERLFRLERWTSQLSERLGRLRRALDEWARVTAEPLYPENFESRLEFLEKLWGDQSRLTDELGSIAGEPVSESRPTPGSLAFVAIGLVAIAAALVAGGALQTVLIPAGVAAIVAGGVSMRAAAQRARDREREREQRRMKTEEDLRLVAERIAELLVGVPHQETLSPETTPDRRERFRAQRKARDDLAQQRASVDELLDAIDIDLPSQGELPLSREPRHEAVERADAVAPVLDREVSRTRTELAQRGIELDSAEAVAIKLPEGLEPRFGAVRSALEECRSDQRGVNARLAELRRRLVEAETGESPLSLAERLDAARAREAELENEAEALREAFALLDDAYTEFRAGDQERLLEAVSAQLERVSGGALGPVGTDSVLEAAHVVVRGRKLPLASPPLSYGELHAVLLAVRLGAADFLAGSGNRAPLLIDEPFTYLDDERAAQVWAQLREVSRERQTIITTQARRLLDQLRVEPDVMLDAPVRVDSSG